MEFSGRLPKCPEFPSLRDENHKITSPATPEYNCIAWAADDQERFWWPDAAYTAHWPEGIAREETLRAFTEAYGTLGYVVCEDDTLEADFEKIAIYAIGTQPTHAARQLEDGL